MARKSSQHFSEPVEVKISGATLGRRWILLGDGLRSCCQLAPADVAVQADVVEDGVTAGLVGRACERIGRNRGRPTFVVPFTRVGRGDLRSWLGFREKWELVSGRLYRFHHVSLTVHFGYEGDVIKPQIFRSEWAGIRAWTVEKIGFQSPGAAHPHWQLDAVQSTGENDTTRMAALARLRGEETVADFHPNPRPDAIVASRRVALERIHFASGAPWWQKDAELQERHMNCGFR